LLTIQGYDQGVFGGLLANPDFLKTFDNPSTTIQGQIVSTYTLGCIFGALLTMFLGDVLGRRKSVALGCSFLTVGGLIQATAFSLPHMIVGRIIGGLGIGINTTTIPMWQSETCKPSLRGKLVSIQLSFLVFGFVLTNWMNFGFTYIPNNPVSWRFPLAFQSALAVGTASLLPMLVESPRWLCLKDRQVEAQTSLSRLIAKPGDHPEVQDLLRIMVDTIAHERVQGEIGWREVFHNGPQQTFRRILLGAGANFMQQMGGVNVVAYYLPVVLERSFGFTPRLALILSACDSMQWMFWAAMAFFVIERFGRVKLMIFGASGQAVCFGVAAIGLGVGTTASNGVAIAFIFLFYFFFVSTLSTC
jgi:sugar porter (SP) family MFS transporter